MVFLMFTMKKIASRPSGHDANFIFYNNPYYHVFNNNEAILYYSYEIQKF